MARSNDRPVMCVDDAKRRLIQSAEKRTWRNHISSHPLLSAMGVILVGVALSRVRRPIDMPIKKFRPHRLLLALATPVGMSIIEHAFRTILWRQYPEKTPDELRRFEEPLEN